MRDSFISVIVPVYNVEEWLQDCLDSILRQDVHTFEIIAVNDGSTDSSPKILEHYSQLDNRIKVVTQSNKGLAGARNAGLAAARGDLIAFIDSDDFVAPNYLSFMLKNMREHNADLSACGRMLYEAPSAVHEVRPAYSKIELGPEDAVKAINSFKSFDMSMWGKLFKRELFDDVVFPEGKNSEDQFVCYKILLRCHSVYYEDAPLYYYRCRLGSISRSSNVNEFPLEASQEQLHFFRNFYPTLVYVGETSYFFSLVQIYNEYTLRGFDAPSHLLILIKSDAIGLLWSVLTNPDISVLKKVQAILFVFCRFIYKPIFLFFKNHPATS